MILTITRVVYYAVNILGPTLLPLVVRGEQGRLVGLILISFLANAINSLFVSD